MVKKEVGKKKKNDREVLAKQSTDQQKKRIIKNNLHLEHK